MNDTITQRFSDYIQCGGVDNYRFLFSAYVNFVRKSSFDNLRNYVGEMGLRVIGRDEIRILEMISMKMPIDINEKLFIADKFPNLLINFDISNDDYIRILNYKDDKYYIQNVYRYSGNENYIMKILINILSVKKHNGAAVMFLNMFATSSDIIVRHSEFTRKILKNITDMHYYELIDSAICILKIMRGYYKFIKIKINKILIMVMRAADWDIPKEYNTWLMHYLTLESLHMAEVRKRRLYKYCWRLKRRLFTEIKKHLRILSLGIRTILILYA